MKYFIVLLFLLLSYNTVFAHGYPELPSPDTCRFENSTVFVCCPAIVGGFALFFPMATVGLVTDILIYPFNQDSFGLGVLFFGCVGTVSGQ
jgi:hypothetical protein